MWSVVFSVVDGKTKKGSFSFNFNPARTVDQIIGWIALVSVPLAVIVKGGITAITISRSVTPLIILPSVADDDSDIEEKMRTSMRTTTGFPAKSSIPTYDETLTNTGTNTVNQGIGAIIAFNTLLESGGTVAGVNVSPSDSRGDDIETVTSQTEYFTSSATGK